MRFNFGRMHGKKDALPAGILDEYCLKIYNPDGELRGFTLRTCSGACDLS